MFFKKQWIIISCLFIVALLYFVLIPNHSYFSEYFEPSSPYGYGELFRIYLTIVAGIIAIIALGYNHRRVTAMEKGNVDTRFSNAVGHLGNDKSSVILGGTHALHEIAVENKNYRKIVHNLFCSYIRENSAIEDRQVRLWQHNISSFPLFLMDDTGIGGKQRFEITITLDDGVVLVRETGVLMLEE